MRARWVIRGGLLLLGGAAVSVALALCSAVMEASPVPSSVARIPTFSFFGERDHVCIVSFRSALGVRRVYLFDSQESVLRHDPLGFDWMWDAMSPHTPDPPTVEDREPDLSWGLAAQYVAWAHRSRFWDPHDPPPAPFMPSATGDEPHCTISAEDARGWPFACLTCVVHHDPAFVAPPLVHGGVLLSGPAATSASLPSDVVRSSRVIPFHVLWSGFAADTAVFSAVLGVLGFGVRSARAAVRRRRGWCPCCGYDLRGQSKAGCPECGAGRADAGPEVL